MDGIDGARQEKRFFLPGDRFEALLAVFKEQDFVVKPSRKGNVTHTMYFLDDEHSLSMGTSFKARRYLTCFSDTLDLGKLQEVVYRCEVKKQVRLQDHEFREKIDGGDLTLRNAESFMRAEGGFHARPYLAVEYHRVHFVKKEQQERIRVTVDTQAHFWFFPFRQSMGIPVGDNAAAEVIRVEIKFDPNAAEEVGLGKFLEAIAAMGALPAISKKAEGLNFVKWWHDRKYAPPGMVNELGECEIEAKFSLEGFDFDALLARLRMFAQGSGMAPIISDTVFPYLLATTTINHYWAKKDAAGVLVEAVKFLARGGTGKVTMKANSKLVNARLGIIERKEVKGKSFPYPCASLDEAARTSLPTETLIYVGYLLRIRKAFWVISPQGRLYHISLERCVANGRSPLDQIEVEYTGKRKQGNPESDHMSAREHIVADITTVAEKVLGYVKGLGDGCITAAGEEKFAWLKQA
jgi:hypothetical protein